MLTASTTGSLGGSQLRSHVFLERRFRANLMLREHLVLDTRFTPAVRGRRRGVVHLYFVRDGAFEINGHGPVTTPACFVLTEQEFDGIERATATTLRASGPRSTSLELRMRSADVPHPAGLLAGQVPVAPEIWAQIDQIIAASDDAAVRLALTTELITMLSARGVIAADVAASIARKEEPHLVRVWDALSPLYGRFDASFSLGYLRQETGLSLRQLGRDMTDLIRTFGLLGYGFRDFRNTLRMRTAVLLLSAPDATATEVARAVGYKSIDAMGRAFRDAKLPPPSDVRSQLVGAAFRSSTEASA